MQISLKSLAKYGVVLAITVAIFWYLFRNIPFEKVKQALVSFDYSWILLSMGISLIGFYLRAWRSVLLFKAEGYHVTTTNSYFAVMIGYLLNSLIPRMGEVFRCGVINRTHKVPVPYAFGTVFTERVIDLLMLAIVTGLAFALEFDLLLNYFQNSESGLINTIKDNVWILAVLGLLGILGLYILFFSPLSKKFPFVAKIKSFVNDVIRGILSIRKIKNKLGFWASTIGIWGIYFLMLYVITLGSDLTKDLGPLAGLSILVMGSFGMASPTPNGVGAFHAFVAGILVLYGISYDDGIIFATIMHSSQYVTVLLFGSISLILVNVLNKAKTVEANPGENTQSGKPS